MSRRFISRALGTIAALIAAAPVWSQVTFEGSAYEVVIEPGITWEDARAAAASSTYVGPDGPVAGRLAVIETGAEDSFVEDQRIAALAGLGVDGALWVGGSRPPCDDVLGCAWAWVSGAAISTTNGGAPYANWRPGEPNGYPALPYYLAIQEGWTDQENGVFVVGYVIEYVLDDGEEPPPEEITIPAAECAASGPGCNPTGYQILKFPPNAIIAPGATLTARTHRFNDNPARCGVEPLTLFDGAVVLPPYLCGNPNFVVIETHSQGVEVPSGVVTVENLTETAVPENLYGCTAERQNPPGVIDPDPSHRDVVGWQAQDPHEMIESRLGAGRFEGTVAELTYGCGSSRGRVLRGSYHFIGLRIAPAPGAEYSEDPQRNRQSFIELTRYKLQVLQTSVIESRPALTRAQYFTLKALVDAALWAHDRGYYLLAWADVRVFLQVVVRTPYTPIPGRNYNGEHVMRASNLDFIYREKLIPYLPRPR